MTAAPPIVSVWPSARSTSQSSAPSSSPPWVSSHSGRSSGCSRIGAPVRRRSSGATRTWSSWAWVHTIALTARPATTARIASTSCGASTTRHCSSSPITHTLLSTSCVSPSRENVPETTAWSTRTAGAHQSTTTERSTSPCVHLVEGGLDVADADLLGHERVEVEPALLVEVDEHREVARGQAVAVPGRLQRPAATEDVDERDVGHLHVRRRHADQHDGAGEVAGVERLLPRLRASDRVDHHVGAALVAGAVRRRRQRRGSPRPRRPPRSSPCGWRPSSAPVSSFRSSRSTAMIFEAPARAAPAIAAAPTPPQPMTATVEPRPTLPVLMAAPRPAITPQPSRPTAAARADGSTFVHWPAATSVFSAKAPMPSAGRQLGAGEVALGERHLLGGVVGGEAVPRLAAVARPAVAAHGAPVEDDEVTRRDARSRPGRPTRRRRPPRGRAGRGSRR